MQTRRDALKTGLAAAGSVAAAGLFAAPAHAATKAAFDGRSVAEAVRAFGGGALAESRDVTINGPEIAENGASVPLSLATRAANVKQLMLVVEKNPTPLVAVFHVSPAIEPSFALRAKMSESSDVYAVAITSDGKALYARREVKVTLGGCG